MLGTELEYLEVLPVGHRNGSRFRPERVVCHWWEDVIGEPHYQWPITEPSDEEWIDAHDVQVFLGMHSSTIARLVRLGRLSMKEEDGKRLLPRREVELFLESIRPPTRTAADPPSALGP